MKTKEVYVDSYEKEFSKQVVEKGLTKEEVDCFEIEQFSSIEVACGHCLYYSTHPLQYWLEHVGPSNQKLLTPNEKEKIVEILLQFESNCEIFV